VSGPLSEFLDTEALIHLARARTESDPVTNAPIAEAALKVLEEAEVQSPTAVTSFQLAQARLAAGNRADAKLAWAEAVRRNLTETDHHPLERADFKAVRNDLDG
jgi:hypothetical protein